MKTYYFLLQLIIIAIDILSKEGKYIGIVMKIMFLTNLVYIALRTDKFSILACLFDAIFLPSFALFTNFQSCLDNSKDLSHFQIAHNICFIVIGLFDIPGRAQYI